ncbi:hypothetical protein ABZW10_03750 [Kitasatospora sp. NPDC004723]|uniref:hypothetical protein n=1 Tax=Kitasatospora sp. NPDC004723 TaxID=3154288 RepID=UPI0033B8F901
MRRLAVAAAAGVLAGTVAVTGCGSISSTGTGGGGSAASTAASAASAAPAASGYAEEVRKGVAEHDRLFPAVAALGCASVPPSPSAGGTGTASQTPDWWAAKHAENSMYKQMAPLNAVDRCRGEAHSRRISEAVKARAGSAPLTQDAVRGILESLGYPRNSAQFVVTGGGEVSFELTIPGAGPCVVGRVGKAVTVEAHGSYLDGGCSEPKGGH